MAEESFQLPGRGEGKGEVQGSPWLSITDTKLVGQSLEGCEADENAVGLQGFTCFAMMCSAAVRPLKALLYTDSTTFITVFGCSSTLQASRRAAATITCERVSSICFAHRGAAIVIWRRKRLFTRQE